MLNFKDDIKEANLAEVKGYDTTVELPQVGKIDVTVFSGCENKKIEKHIDESHTRASGK